MTGRSERGEQPPGHPCMSGRGLNTIATEALALLMPRFPSLEYAPAETRRLLRERLQRQLGREPTVEAPAPNGLMLDDERMLLLLQRGEVRSRDLSCRSPTWVVARLWDRTLSSESDIGVLRTWVDRWRALSAPEFVPSRVWDGPTAERFRQLALEVLQTDPTLASWEQIHARFARELGAKQGRAPQDVGGFIPAAPQTLVDRALWLEDNRVEMLALESLEAYDDVLGLERLLLADIEAQPFCASPHPIAVRLFDIATIRPDVFLQLVLWVRWHPRLLADLLLHPPTCALACLIIAHWRLRSSAFDREVAEHYDELEKAAAFEDAVAILAWSLEKGSVRPSETAALLACLHRSAGNGFIDDLADQERLRMALRNALVLVNTGTLQLMVDALVEKHESLNPLGARFAATLELVTVGELAKRIDPAPIVNAYIDGLGKGDATLSVQRIGIEGAVALFALAQRSPELLDRFLRPIDARARLAQADKPDVNPIMVAEALARSLRAHIRVLCRGVAGCSEPVSTDLVAALASAVQSGALSHKEKGRVAAFAPRHEANALGVRRDRPIATDLAAALRTVSGDNREQLLSAILETDEPMVLAQLLPFAPRETRSRIERRIQALPPAEAGPTYSLIEVQARIDELLSAGALGAAAKFIEEEERLQTLGKVHGREIARLRSRMRLLFARREWDEILAAQLPPDLGWAQRDAAEEVLQLYKGLTLLVRPDGRDPRAAEEVFQELRRRRPHVAAYAINAIAAQIGGLLSDDVFGRLDGPAARSARQVLAESDALASNAGTLSRIDRDTLARNRAILNLALGQPERALALLASTISTHLDERTHVYRAVALSRLGRVREAVSVLKAAEDDVGKTELVEAAWGHIRESTPYPGTVGVSSNDDPVAPIREAYRDLHVLDPIQQASVISLSSDPFTAFVTEQVRGAAASVVAVVPMMEVVKLDGCEDNVTAVIRELLLSRLHFLRWSVPDQSKGGITPRGNPGERDLMIMCGSTILTVIEAVICRTPIHWQSAQENLRRHFQKLLAYGTCRLFFHLTYVYDQDVHGLLEHLKTTAGAEAPPGFAFVGLTEIALTDSRPHGFVACYGDGQGDLKVVFLALDMGQEKQKAAAAASAS